MVAGGPATTGATAQPLPAQWLSQPGTVAHPTTEHRPSSSAISITDYTELMQLVGM